MKKIKLNKITLLFCAASFSATPIIFATSCSSSNVKTYDISVISKTDGQITEIITEITTNVNEAVAENISIEYNITNPRGAKKNYFLNAGSNQGLVTLFITDITNWIKMEGDYTIYAKK